MVNPKPWYKELLRVPARIYGWELLTCIYSGFDCGSGGFVEKWVVSFCGYKSLTSKGNSQEITQWKKWPSRVPNLHQIWESYCRYPIQQRIRHTYIYMYNMFWFKSLGLPNNMCGPETTPIAQTVKLLGGRAARAASKPGKFD